MLTHNAIEYTLQHLFRVALPHTEDFVIGFSVEGLLLTIQLQDGFTVSIPLLDEQEEKAFLKGQLPVSDLEECASHHNEVIVFRPAHYESDELKVEDKHVSFYFDIVTPSFLLLSRKEETLTDVRDRHGRFRYQDSLSSRYGLIMQPLVDEYALILREKLLEAGFPTHRLQKRQGRLIPTHDIDHLMRFTGQWQAMKSIFGRDLLIDHKLRVVRHSLREYREWKQDRCRDPYITAIQDLVEMEKGLPAIFFFMAQTAAEQDAAYDISAKETAAALRMVNDAGMTIGLHGSYDSYDDEQLLNAQRQRLQNASGQPVTCGRQHYLRFEAGASGRQPSLEVWQKSGITDDYSLGYAEYPGFRCGTCHPYPLYDLQNDRASSCIEHPLILMDGTLFDYLRLSLQDCKSLIQKHYNSCMAVEGDFVILWHNHLLRRIFYPLTQHLYKPLIQQHLSKANNL